MADDQHISAAGKTSVGYQADRITEPKSDDCRGRSEHFAHSRPALWPFVSNHDDVAAFDLSLQDRLHRLLLRIIYLGLAGDLSALDPGNFRDGTFLGKISAQDREMSFGIERFSPRSNNVLVIWRL